MKKELSIAMLGWRGHETTSMTLATYAQSRLYDTAGEFFIHFNNFCEEDRKLAEKFGVRAIGTPENLGIWGGMDAIAAAAKGDYILFLQNDHPVVVSPEETRRWIESSVELIESGKADIVLLCNRFAESDNNNSSKYFRYFPVRELDPRVNAEASKLPKDFRKDTWRRRLMRLLRPFNKWHHAYHVMFLEAHPDKVFPQYIRREGAFYINDSAIRAFSETPYLISKRFYNELSAWAKRHSRRDTILGFQILEIVLNCHWWRKQHYKIAFCEDGVFSHRRVDDSWRKTNQAYNSEMVKMGWNRADLPHQS